MEALKEAVEEHGVTHMAAICAICKSQFTKVLPLRFQHGSNRQRSPARE
jgi:hypothetical protein